MSSHALLLSLLVLGFCPGCISTTTPESTSYAEWKQEQKARWEAKKAGTEYKTKAQIRQEAEEMRAVAAEVMNSAVKRPPAASASAKPESP